MKIFDFILCEDIRQEEGRKSSLMGVFGNEIVLHIPAGATKPLVFRLGLFLRLLMEEGDPPPDNVRIKIIHNTEEIASIEGKIGIVGEPRIIVVPVSVSRLPIPGAGTLRFNFTVWSAGTTIFEETFPMPIALSVIEKSPEN